MNNLSFKITLSENITSAEMDVDRKEIIVDAKPYSTCAYEIVENIKNGFIVNLEKNNVKLNQSEYANLYDLVNKTKLSQKRGYVIFGYGRRYNCGSYRYFDMFEYCNAFNAKVEAFYGPDAVDLEYSKMESCEMDDILSKLP